MEIPRAEIAHAMEAATAATSSNANLAEEPDDDVRTLAKPEMEVDIDDAGHENQPDEEQQDPDANENQDEVAERRLYFSKRTSISSTLFLPKQQWRCKYRTIPKFRTRTASTPNLFPSHTRPTSFCNVRTCRG